MVIALGAEVLVAALLPDWLLLADAELPDGEPLLPPDEALVDVEEPPDAEFPEELPEELPEEEAPEAEFPDFAKEEETVVLDAFLPPACR